MSTSEERWFVVSPRGDVRGLISIRPWNAVYYSGPNDKPKPRHGYKLRVVAEANKIVPNERVVTFDEAVAIHAMSCARRSMEGA